MVMISENQKNYLKEIYKELGEELPASIDFYNADDATALIFKKHKELVKKWITESGKY